MELMVPPTATTPQTRLILLGAPHVERDDQVVHIRHRKPLALLAYLAVTRQVHSRETLAALFWPEHDSPRAFAYLRNALWQLGQTAVGPWLDVEQDVVALEDDVWADVPHFEKHLTATRAHDHASADLCQQCLAHLSEATALYRGDFLEGFTLEDSPAFDEWQFFQAEHLRQEATLAMERLALYHSAQGDIEAALAVTLRWAARDSLNESANRYLMQLYAADGQRAAALHQYETLLRRLKASRLEPAPETISLYQQIRAGDVRQRPMSQIPLPVPAQAAPRPLHNLPALATLFVGRQTELQQLGELLTAQECRLITLTGPGGVGKTRLALEAAHTHREVFSDGAIFVPLAAVTSQDLLVPAIADALGTAFYPQSAIRPVEQLLSYLGTRTMLLILDNMEHLIGESETLSAILTQAPHTKLLVTSRERLGLQGEWVMEVRGLAYPTRDDEMPAAYDAVALFVETARRTSSSFAPDDTDLGAIARICELVEGIPLGIELAAAWTKMLTCAEIAEEVATSLDFLTLTLRDLPERHQSLRAVFARSWGLLSEEERRHFRALALFRGGFTREAAAGIAGAGLPALSALMDKSLLYRTPQGRYEILEILRQYAEEQLKAVPGEADKVAAQHAAYYLDLVRGMELPLMGDLEQPHPVGQREALEIVQRDLDNIRAAWRWSLQHQASTSVSGAAFALALFYEIRSRFREGEAMFAEAAEALRRQPDLDDTGLLMLFRALQGEFLCRMARIPEGSRLIEESFASLAEFPDSAWLPLVEVLSTYIGLGLSSDERRRRLQHSLQQYQALGNTWGVALSQEVLASTYLEPGSVDTIQNLLQDSLELRRKRGDEWGTAITLYTLAVSYSVRGDIPRCLDLIQQSLELRARLGDIRGMAICQSLIARLMAHQGNKAMAQHMHAESARAFKEIGDIPSMTSALLALGQIARERGDSDGADQAFQAAYESARAINYESGIAASLHQLGKQALHAGDRATARARLDESLLLFRHLGNSSAAADVEADLARL